MIPVRRSARTIVAMRRAKAPREPIGVAASYARALGSVLDRTQEAVRRILFPVLDREFGDTGPGLASAPDSPDAMIGVTRTDAACAVCGVSAPGWYLRLAEHGSERRDALLDGPLAVALSNLVVAIARITSEGNLSPLVDAQGRRIGAWNAREMSRVLGIDLTRRETGLGSFIESFRRTNVRLIRSIPSTELDQIEAILSRATAQGSRVEAVRREIEERFDVSRSRATLIARDQTLKANADVSQLRQQNAGVEHYFWISSLDERVRGRPGGTWEKSESNHWRLHNTRQSWLVAPITNPKRGIRNHPGKDYQCRCIAAPDTEALLGT